MNASVPNTIDPQPADLIVYTIGDKHGPAKESICHAQDPEICSCSYIDLRLSRQSDNLINETAAKIFYESIVDQCELWFSSCNRLGAGITLVAYTKGSAMLIKPNYKLSIDHFLIYLAFNHCRTSGGVLNYCWWVVHETPNDVLQSRQQNNKERI
ncbi:hypothetical protein BD560DRAFT_421427 [Blakeslea trispora]|nr:hypothetical protein BD560DRAFT_421427 [Blakeslea trispora]